jgi:hypothetical protein
MSINLPKCAKITLKFSTKFFKNKQRNINCEQTKYTFFLPNRESVLDVEIHLSLMQYLQHTGSLCFLLQQETLTAALPNVFFELLKTVFTVCILTKQHSISTPQKRFPCLATKK